MHEKTLQLSSTSKVPTLPKISTSYTKKGLLLKSRAHVALASSITTVALPYLSTLEIGKYFFF